jgi:hypothetical protein
MKSDRTTKPESLDALTAGKSRKLPDKDRSELRKTIAR